jgi:hypothetical protein
MFIRYTFICLIVWGRSSFRFVELFMGEVFICLCVYRF